MLEDPPNGDRWAVPHLIAKLQDSNVRIRNAAAIVLTHLGDVSAVEALLAMAWPQLRSTTDGNRVRELDWSGYHSFSKRITPRRFVPRQDTSSRGIQMYVPG